MKELLKGHSMAEIRYDIAVAGCGPAGLAAALLLSRAGHRVTIFDQFVEPQPLGSGLILQPTGLAVLAELGLDWRLLQLGRRIDRLYGRVCPSQRTVLDVRYAALGPGSFGLAVHRAALFQALHDAVRREGIPLRIGDRIVGHQVEPGSGVRLLRDGGSTEAFDFVVDALGARSALAPAFGRHRPRTDLAYGALWANVPWPSDGFAPNALEQRYERAHAMVGVLPIGRPQEDGAELAAFFWSLRVDRYEAWRAAGLDTWKADVRLLWPEAAPLLDGIRDPEMLTFARYTHHTLARPRGEGIVAIGDAAHAASPQLGQGANMALLDAYALAVALNRSPHMATAFRAYAELRRWHIRFYQALSAVFTPFYQSDSRVLPLMRDRLIAPATRWPGLRWLVAGSVAGTLLGPHRELSLAVGSEPGLAPDGDGLAGTGLIADLPRQEPDHSALQHQS